jgi:hypothetical protein
VFPAEPNPAWTEEGTKGDWTQFLFWTKVEVLIFAGYIGSPILFNFIRAFKRTTYELINPATGESPDADMLEANMLTIGIICSFCAPLLATSFITVEEHFTLLEEETQLFANIMWWMQCTQVCIAFYVTFVPFYLFRGPDTPHCFNKYMGYGHVTLTILLFQGFPILSLGWYCAARYMTDVSETYLNSYFALYLFQAFPLILWYDHTIHLTVFDIAR